jgi:hypothetical protein
MTNRLELNWKLDGFVDEQRYYCSETPIDVNNLPVPKVIIAEDARTYTDTAIEVGKTYYVAVSSVKGSIEKVSQVIKVFAGGDPHWDKVVALLHLDGDLVDVRGNKWARQGGMQLSYTDPKFGSGCAYSDGSYDSNLHMTSPIPKLLDSDFCIEMYYKPVNTETWYSIFNTYGVGNTAERNLIISNEFGKLTATLITITDDNDFTLNKWHHVAYTRQGGTLRLFLDGVLVGSGTITGRVRTDAIYIGQQPYSLDWSVPGFYDELRITKGVARYTANFPPPDAPFPNY